jgi:hypothetical protein
MNVNEWFNSSALYDFDVDGNYSMSNSDAMAKFATNGTHTFTIKQ